MDLFLKADTCEQMTSALQAAGFIQEDNLFYKEGCSLLVLGRIQKITGDGESSSVELLEGFHANLRTEDQDVIDCLLPFHNTPKTPLFVWLD